MHESVLEDGLHHHARAIGNGIDRHELGLHVGGKAGIRRRAHIDRTRPPGRARQNAFVGRLPVEPSLLKFVECGAHLVGPCPKGGEFSAGGHDRAQEGARLDAVGHDGVLAPCKASTPRMVMRSVPAPSI